MCLSPSASRVVSYTIEIASFTICSMTYLPRTSLPTPSRVRRDVELMRPPKPAVATSMERDASWWRALLFANVYFDPMDKLVARDSAVTQCKETAHEKRPWL